MGKRAKKVKTNPLTVWAIRKPTGDIIIWAMSRRRDRAIRAFIEQACRGDEKRPISVLWREFRRRGWSAIRVTMREARP